MGLVDHRLAADANGPAGPSSSYASATPGWYSTSCSWACVRPISGFGKAQVRTVPTPTVAVSRRHAKVARAEPGAVHCIQCLIGKARDVVFRPEVDEP